MKVEVSTDRPIAESALKAIVATVEAGLTRYEDRLTRAEVHLKNVDGSRPGQSPTCSLEARPAGREPVVVTHSASTVEEAVKGAAGKMARLLDSAFGRLESQKGGQSSSGLPS
jgi:hypothetical protein